ncbi:hypothetical protein IWQ47_004286 [Aquimarina sp. EL_43]|uniref:hypothetical protein n=1 Tax=unclassified Aquimarina TaxID=2627091 RepID=UPI0018CA4C80|nr:MULTISPECIES: hypothetical protein [unclassified Aquimarina]MBG6133050.1 hypothetical protein [Aquimarina sp. EL_35]MBG6152361.1 hypothetical protein [Aquimarina sp. EL_32]MBG6171199.1 hypothetical protein [Aquimarina sp. EL_43]
MKTSNRTIAIPKNSRSAKKAMMSFLLLGLAILLLGSCKNDDNDIIIERIINGIELQKAIKDNREEAMQTFVMNAELGGHMYGEEGTRLHFLPNSFLDQNGDPVSGSVTIELVEIYDKAKMLLTKMPTNGKRPNGDIETLKSAGEFFVNANQNGNQLQLANAFEIFSPNEDFDPEMRLFKAADDGCDSDVIDCDVVWEENQEGNIDLGQGEGPNGTGVTGYSGFISNFGWTNIDRWYNDPRPKTVIYVDAPEGYDNTNCNIYVSYDGEPTALALLDTYIEETELFSEHYGLIPIGLEVHFIFVSVQDGEYTYAIQGATITEDHVEVIGSTTTGTEAELITLINGLP